METKHTPGPWLTRDQVHALNEKHGWFKYGDAVGDVSRQFAQDAIDMHERIRRAAPDLLEAVQRLIPTAVWNADYWANDPDTDEDIVFARAAIAKATGDQG